MQISDVISAFHETVPTPAVVPIVVEQPSRTLTAERYEARTTARLRSFESGVNDYCAAGEGLFAQLRAAERDADGAVDLADLSGLIDFIEKTAEASAKGNARGQKDTARTVRRVERDDATLAQAPRRAAVWQEQLNLQLIEQYLSIALRLRAFRSTLRVEEAAPTFDDPEELHALPGDGRAGATVRVTVEPGFTLGLRTLPPNRQKAAIRGLAKFQQSPNLPHLHCRPLEGSDGFFIIDPRRGDRIILRRIAEGHYAAVDVGPHDDVYRRWDRLR